MVWVVVVAFTQIVGPLKERGAPCRQHAPAVEVFGQQAQAAYSLAWATANTVSK